MEHIATTTSEITINLECKAQIALLKVKEAPVSVSAKYLDFTNIFSEKLAVMLPEFIKINTHANNLVESKQPPYRYIHGLSPVELETLKTYNETNLANDFIYLSKSPATTLILFEQKPDRNLQLYIDYQGFNNLTFKN